VFVYVNVGHFKVQYSSHLLLNVTVHKGSANTEFWG